jgi:hypothetical protein
VDNPQSEFLRIEDANVDLNNIENEPSALTVLTQSRNHSELLDYFLSADMPERGLNKTDISEQSGVSTNGIRRHIDIFLDFGIIRETTPTDVHINRYTNDTESELFHRLKNANNALAVEYRD